MCQSRHITNKAGPDPDRLYYNTGIKSALKPRGNETVCIRPREHGSPVRLEPGVRYPQVGGERGDDGGLLDPGVGIRDRAGGKKKAWKDHQEDEARRPARMYRDLALINRKLEQGVPMTKIAKELGLHRNTLATYMNFFKKLS